MLWAHARVRPRLRVTAGLAGLAAALAAVTLVS